MSEPTYFNSIRSQINQIAAILKGPGPAQTFNTLFDGEPGKSPECAVGRLMRVTGHYDFPALYNRFPVLRMKVRGDCWTDDLCHYIIRRNDFSRLPFAMIAEELYTLELEDPNGAAAQFETPPVFKSWNMPKPPDYKNLACAWLDMKALSTDGFASFPKFKEHSPPKELAIF